MNYRPRCKMKTTKPLEDKILRNKNKRKSERFLIWQLFSSCSTKMAQSIKEITDKLEISKIKNFYSEEDNVERIGIQGMDQEKIFAKHMSDKELLSNTHKGLLKVNKRNKQTS